METILTAVDFIRTNATAIAICIGFPIALALVFRGDGPSVNGSYNDDGDGGD
ncbi:MULTISPECIES: hypothetical protein [unclassified Yoonia]|uniref:hypothetical protein n=1 Tax=unclassified Yoonia TaxID=2629118 RepID=UPI002AFE1478|nr:MULTISPECIES: hypothetical protein [unclassified Yoonia]